MVEDPKWELAILATVQGFYEKLLQEAVDGEVPVPAGLETVSLQDDDVEAMLMAMRRWLLIGARGLLRSTRPHARAVSPAHSHGRG